MTVYGNFNINKKKKKNKIWIAVACIAAALAAMVCYIGIVAGSDSEGMRQISSAVAENTQLKEQVNELNAEIARLNEEIASLTAQLEARPTAAPEMPAATADTSNSSDTSGTVIPPRTGRRQ